MSYNVIAHINKVHSVRSTTTNYQCGPDIQLPGGLAGSEGEMRALGGMSLLCILRQSSMYILAHTELLISSGKQRILGQEQECHRCQVRTDTQALIVNKQRTDLIFLFFIFFFLKISFY